ncbi:MAG: CDP-glucose 4,6-dehydratase [Telmatospirillum sp.]|nr:CDP-glucose 4,6-dehydratase [Telmatospirillum sp.]
MEDLVVSGSPLPDPAFWRGRTVLLTGHTGFKGAWMTIWLHRMGARVIGLALPPADGPTLFEDAGVDRLCESHFVDIRDATGVAEIVQSARPDIIFHLAAQALVRVGYAQPLATFAVNVQGTANVLDALRRVHQVRAAVMVTSDKVYRNLETAFPFRESDPLGGYDPYSASKAAAEMVIACYRSSFLADADIAVASARAGNVIGGGDWAPDRLIPDAIRAWQAGHTLHVRRPDAIRPWQHVLEPVASYLVLAERLWTREVPADSYNFGPVPHEAATVRSVVEMARSIHSGGVSFGDGTAGPHEAGWLALETAKARSLLGLAPRWPLQEAVRRTVAWYVSHRHGSGAKCLCDADIGSYEANE